jgi:hypothetical protein
MPFRSVRVVASHRYRKTLALRAAWLPCRRSRVSKARTPILQPGIAHPGVKDSRDLASDTRPERTQRLARNVVLADRVARHTARVRERARCQTYFPGDWLRAINRIRDLSGRIKQREKLIISGTNQRLKVRRRSRRMLNRSARDHRSVAHGFERRGASNALNRESPDVHHCSLSATMGLRKMLSFNHPPFS